MKIHVGPALASAPKGFLRVKFVEEPNVRRIVRQGMTDTLELSTGKLSDFTLRKYVVLCRRIVQCAKQHGYKKIALDLDGTPSLLAALPPMPHHELYTIAAQNFEMANYEFNAFKSRPKEGWKSVDDILLCGKSSKAGDPAVHKGQEIGRAVNYCRDLSNTPGGDMTPTSLANAAKKAVVGTKARVKVLGLAEIKKHKMGALLGVAKGSDEPPTFTVMQYQGGKGAPIVLIGKGITFDTGGINIKSESGIGDMHMDMSGGAAVIATLALAAKLQVKRNVIGLIPAAENMPSGGALRPHDVLRSMSGKTIEVGNTDAEGRLILADALTYAKRFKPAAVIDVATLTGASMVALGLHASGLLTRNDTLADELLKHAEASGDYLWRLPLWDEYEDGLKSEIADMNNVPGSGPGSRYGGATNGAIFLWQFAKELECPWAHLDIAPRMTAIPSDELGKGAIGTPVRLLIKFIQEHEAVATARKVPVKKR